MSRPTAFHVRTSLATGAVVALAAFGAAYAGGGLAAFFVVIVIGAPLAALADDWLARRAGLGSGAHARERDADGARRDGRGDAGGGAG